MIALHHGDSLDVLPTLPDASMDAVVTDPPYELGFMGRAWDASGIAYNVDLWRECLRVLKPGGFLLAFGGTRTVHRMACAIEDAGMEIRDGIDWIYGTGFPKSRASLKPAREPIVVARKPLAGTVAANVVAYGAGALNIDACRVGTSKRVPASPRQATDRIFGRYGAQTGAESGHDPNIGRWPANVVLSHAPDCADPCVPGCPVAELDERARFFPVFRYQAKAPARERPKVDGISHPTVKPLELMRWLVRLVTPPGGIVLDPFAGSGTTAEACALEGFGCVAIEREAAYLPQIASRLDRVPVPVP